MQLEDHKTDPLLQLSISLLFVFSLSGCSFDASKLRAEVRKDAALAAPPLDGSQDNGHADEPLALADISQETSVLADEDAALDVPTTDAPAEAQTGHPETTSVLPEVDVPIDVPGDNTIIQPDAADRADPSDDSALTDDGPSDVASGAGGSMDVPSGSGGMGTGDVTSSQVVLVAQLARPTMEAWTRRQRMDSAAMVALRVLAEGALEDPAKSMRDRTVGRPTRSPSIRSHLPPGSALPWFLTVGPDNNLWIAEHTSGKILKYTIADGTFKEFQAIASGVTIEGITLGP
jgi:hypothetical protein